MAVQKGEDSSGGAELPPAAAAPVDSASLGPMALAEAILARKLRPRVADVRRIAEALLETARSPGKKKKKKKKDGTKAKKAAGRKRKLIKIPGQQDGQ